MRETCLTVETIIFLALSLVCRERKDKFMPQENLQEKGTGTAFWVSILAQDFFLNGGSSTKPFRTKEERGKKRTRRRARKKYKRRGERRKERNGEKLEKMKATGLWHDSVSNIHSTHFLSPPYFLSLPSFSISLSPPISYVIKSIPCYAFPFSRK